MGTGWSYFNNVCEALRVAIGVVGVAIGLLAISGGWWGVSQYMQRANPDTLQAAPADPNGETAPAASNAAPFVPHSAAPASAVPSRSNAVAAPAASSTSQPAAPAEAKPAKRAGSHPDFYHQNARPNPQFSGNG